MAHSEARANKARTILEDEGFVVQLRAVAVSQADNCFEVTVLPSEAKEARDFLNEQLL
jgi:hypothetical protein